MVTLNLLWPTWARLVARLPFRTVQARGFECWRLVQLAARLLVDAQDRERQALSCSECSKHFWVYGDGNKPGGAALLCLYCPAELPDREASWGRVLNGRWYINGHELKGGVSDDVAPILSRFTRSARKTLRGALVLALLLSASAARAEEPEDKGGALFRALGLALYGTKAGDLVSTELLIAGGGRELNPFMQSRGARIAATAAAPILVNWTSEELRKDGHPKLALWMRISAVAFFGYATAHNLRAR